MRPRMPPGLAPHMARSRRVDCKPRQQPRLFGLPHNQRRQPSLQARTRFAMAPPAEASPGPSALSAAPAEPAPASSSMSSSVSGFFSNIFGGGSSAPAAAPQPAAVTTASTAHVEPETSSWSNSTVVNEGKARPDTAQKAVKQHTQTAAIAPVAPPVRVAKTSGKYKVHIAALRSRAEAEASGSKTRRHAWRRSRRSCAERR